MKKIYKLLLIFIMSLLLIDSNSFSIAAENTGSISLTLAVEEDIDGNRIKTNIPGAEFNIYKVWSTNEDLTAIEFTPLFAGLTSIDSDMSADEIQKKVELFMPRIEETEPDPIAVVTTDSNGKLSIELEYGAYLFVQNEACEYDGSFYLTSPFLVTIPMRGSDGKLLFNVDASPKPEIVKEPDIDKDVNGAEHCDLKAKNEVVTYTITTAIPGVAKKSFTVIDKLEPVLEFVDKPINEVVTVKIGDYTLTDEEVRNQVSLDNNTLVFKATKKQLKYDRGKKLIISFKAKIKDDADLTPYAKETVPNDADYEIDNKFRKKSRPVTITPPPRRPPRRPPITGIIMEEISKNPWILVVILIVIIISIKAYLDNKNRFSKQ